MFGTQKVVLETGEPARLIEDVARRFEGTPRIVDGALRVEIANGHRFITEVVEAFPGAR